jgi:glycosyltransferase involved in cell wall biosynthesis
MSVLSQAMQVALVAPPALPLAMTLLNLVTWTRGRSGARRHDGSVSVLVPARDEEKHIEACVRAVAASEHPLLEIVVYDDQSTDGTRAILERLQEEIDELRIVDGIGVPDGWVGKPHACHQLARHAHGDLLVFIDADTLLMPDGIGRIVSCLQDEEAAVVTAMPRQRMETLGERLMIPLLLLTYTSWFPLALVAKSRDPRFVAANGQLLAVTREAYREIGGFAAVGREIVDDVAFCRNAKERGARVVFADGSHMAECRMYGSFAELWRGFSKNIYEGIGGTPIALAVTVALYAGVFVVPYLALVAAAVAAPSLLVAALLGVAFNVFTRALLLLSHRHPIEGLLLHPVSVVALLALAANSFRWSRRGALRWAGRTYAARPERLEVAS